MLLTLVLPVSSMLFAQEDLAVMTPMHRTEAPRPTVEVFEDPATEMVRIVTPEDSYLIELIDDQGLLVSSGPVKGAERIDLKDIPPGRYTVHVRTFSGSAYCPLLVPER
ncbi:MAG: T9SS type A sorting domain-containing protein [Flavobacteriales bacterium]|nr:T9SS type A sorting domain-containing protein [Flavobacteriales bacterium]MCB9194532.1 T9SS type A sorting domain-containing protein [Flavobacteriales bacterium]